MDREQIIRMARETDLVPSWMQNIPAHQLKWIEDFAALVAAAAKEEMLMAGNDQWLEEARKVEREACADMVEDMDVQHPKYIAAAIRARGQA